MNRDTLERVESLRTCLSQLAIAAGEAAKAADDLETEVTGSGARTEVLIGQVASDLHEIRKTLLRGVGRALEIQQRNQHSHLAK